MTALCGDCMKVRPHKCSRHTPRPSRVRPAGQRRRHGLGASGVSALLAEQGGSCAICGVPYADLPGQRLAMDHDHRHCPGKIGCPACVRGMLDHKCNNILRLANDDPELLRKAAAYLDKHREKAFWWEPSVLSARDGQP